MMAWAPTRSRLAKAEWLPPLHLCNVSWEGATARHGACAKVKSTTEQHVADIWRRIIELNRLKRALSEPVAQCRGEEIQGCPILRARSDPGAQ